MKYYLLIIYEKAYYWKKIAFNSIGDTLISSKFNYIVPKNYC